MARMQRRQEGGLDRQESLGVDALPINGADDQALWRAHMRGLTLARQAAERRRQAPAFEARLDRSAREEAVREREAEMDAELARLHADHLAWQREHGLPDSHESRPRRLLPPDDRAQRDTAERFMVILGMLRHGITIRGWSALIREVQQYALVARRGHGLDLRPVRPVAFEGALYDGERPICVRISGAGIIRMVDDADGQLPPAGEDGAHGTRNDPMQSA